MNRPKTSLTALIMQAFPFIRVNSAFVIGFFLAINFSVMGMQNTNFNAALSEAQKILKRPSLDNLALIKLGPNAEIGYGSKACIAYLNKMNIPAHNNSGLVPVLFPIPNIQQTAKAQIDSEKNEIKNLFCSNPPTAKELPIVQEYLKQFKSRKKRLQQEAEKYASALSFPKPELMPIELLNDITTFNPDSRTQVSFAFNGNKEIKELKENFKKKPTSSYFIISEKSTNGLINISANAPDFDDLKDEVEKKIYFEIAEQKEKLRTKKIITRDPIQYEDLQSLASAPLNWSNIIQHNSNYHSHGPHGYSEESERHNILTQQFNGKNSISSLLSHQTGINKRKLSQINPADFSDLNDCYKKLKPNNSNNNLS